MGTLRGEEIIARSFQHEGVDTIFFMLGGPPGGTAFRGALEGKRGPVDRDLPGDILSGKVGEDRINWVKGPYRTEARPAGDPALIREAIAMLAEARKPLIVTGSGVLWSRAEDALREFVDSTGIP